MADLPCDILAVDCAALVGESFDVMICDPPYRAHVHEAATSCGTGGFSPTGRGVRRRDLGFQRLGYGLRRTVAALAAQTQRWSLVYSDVESLTRWRVTCEVRGLEYIRVVPWVRWSQPQLSGDRPAQGWEAVSVFHPPGRKRWAGYGELTGLRHEPDLVALEHKALRGEGKHKAEKPLDQALDLVSWFSDPGDMVLDPTCGRGTVGLACRILGRGFVGCELDPAEADRARARVDSHLSDRDRERVRRYVEGVRGEPVVSEKFPPAQKRQACRVADAERAAAFAGLA